MYAEQLLPQDIEAEEAAIGALLIDGLVFLQLSTFLKPEDFYRERNRLCYQACADLYDRGDAIDQVTVFRELSRTGNIESVGGMAYLSHLVSITPTSAHAEHYGRLVSRTSTMRRLIQAGAKISALGYADTDDVESTLRGAEKELFSVRESQPTGSFVSLREIYDEYLSERADLTEVGAAAAGPIMSGFEDIDELTGGWQRSDLVILAARPGRGKSALALNVAVSAARAGHAAGVFSMEMSRMQLAMRLVASEAGVDAHRVRLGLYTEAEEQRIIEAVGFLSGLPVYIDDAQFQSASEMRAKASRLAQERGLDLLVVDYLQLIEGEGRNRRSENRTMEITEISRTLKGMAGELNVPLIACSQLNRSVESRPGHRPILSDLRDSGSIEQDADLVMFIHRDDSYYDEDEWDKMNPGQPYPHGIAEIILAKHRHGPTASVRLRFRAQLVRFETLFEPSAVPA